MRRLPAAAGTLLFLVVAPGVVGVLVPWQLTGWHSAGPAMWLEILGRILLASGREYREIEAGERWPNWETFHRICELYGWPQKFVGR